MQAKAMEMRKSFKEQQDRDIRVDHLYRREHHRKWYQSPQPLEDIK